MAIDWNKPIRTKGGQKARLLGDLKNAPHPKAVAVDKGDHEVIHTYSPSGKYTEEVGDYHLDLVNYETVTIPECWVVWWPIALNHAIHSSLDSCDGALEKGAILVKHIPAEEREV